MQGGLAAQFAVMGNGETMRFVAQPLEQEESWRPRAQKDRVFATGEEETLLALFHHFAAHIGQHPALGDAGSIDAAGERQLFEHGIEHRELPFAAVNEDEVGQSLLGQPAAQPAFEHLVKGGIVVGSLDAADAEVPILPPGRLTINQYRHRADALPALDVGDVEALHAPRQAGQLQSLADLREDRFARLPPAASLAKRLGGVARRQLHQLQLLATPGRKNRHFLPLAIAEPFAEGIGVLERERQQHLVGDKDLAPVELLQKARKKLHLIQSPGNSEAAPSDQIALTDEKNGDLHFSPLAVHANDILVAAAGRHHLLPFHRLLDSPNLVAQRRRLFEAQAGRRSAHPLTQQRQHLAFAPRQQCRHAPDQLAVLRLADFSIAGGAALADLIKKARATAAPAGLQRVMAQGKDPINFLERFAHGAAGGIGAEIEGAVALNLAHDLQCGKLLTRIETDGNIGLVVAQVDIVTGSVLLDQGILKDQRLFFGIGDNRLERAHPVHQEPDMRTAVAFGRKVRTQAAAQILRLADVENLARLALHQIDAREIGEFFRIDLLHDHSRQRKKVRANPDSAAAPVSRWRLLAVDFPEHSSGAGTCQRAAKRDLILPATGLTL